MRNYWSLFCSHFFISKSGIEFSLKVMFHIIFIFCCFSWFFMKKQKESFSLFYVIFNFKAFPFILNFYSLGKRKGEQQPFFARAFRCSGVVPSLKFNLSPVFAVSVVHIYIHIFIQRKEFFWLLCDISLLMLMIW